VGIGAKIHVVDVLLLSELSGRYHSASNPL